MIQSGDIDGALRHLEKNAKAGDPTALSDLSYLYFEKKGDLALGKQWQQRALAANDPWALEREGDYFGSGKFGYPEKLEQAVALYRRAATEAMAKLDKIQEWDEAGID
ncbi:MAG: hypothetical protein LBG66_05910, partial [Gallionellaceae bacterium]|nr:hypothetical protein [Gallionellaceae bacterium]